MDPELETLEASFNERAEQWISKQGLMFQFSHNTGAGSMFPKICGLVFRLIILAVLGLVCFWFYLTNQPNSASFRDSVIEQVQKGMHAGEVEIKNITRDKGKLLSGEMLISNVALGESDHTFFEDWHVIEEDVSVVGRRSMIERKKTATFQGVNLSPLDLGDNYFSGWSAKEMKIQKMELKLKTGADTDDLAKAAYSTLFTQYESLDIDAIQIFDATLLWGHSETSSGSIKGARLDIVKGVDSWEINVTDGTFSHGWLRDAGINSMKVICKKSGEVNIESASLSLGVGSLSFSASIQIKAQPELTGNYSFENVEVLDLIGRSYESWLDGNIIGKGELNGKLNSAEGIKVTTTINLSGSAKVIGTEDAPIQPNASKDDSVIIVRGDNFQLLKLMQMKDPRNSYSLLRAHKGQVIVESQGKDTQVTLKDVRCGLNDLILMKGQFEYAIRTAKSKEADIDASSLELNESDLNPDKSQSSNETLETVRAFSGQVKLGLIPDVFENNIRVLDVYPVDNATLRVWFDVELSGQLEELTEELADKLYDIMKGDENN